MLPGAQKWETVEKAAFKWPLSMHEEWPELRHHTKSHSQWVTLIREHAQLVVDDTFVNDLYEKHCFQDEYLERWAPLVLHVCSQHLPPMELWSVEPHTPTAPLLSSCVGDACSTRTRSLAEGISHRIASRSPLAFGTVQGIYHVIPAIRRPQL